MNDLVRKLEAQHRALERVVSEVNAALNGKDPAGVASGLGKLQSMIHAHLSLENSQFYPAFESGGSRKGVEVARMFAQNMRLIADGLGVFFNRYSTPPSDLARFEREWKSMVDVLANRIAAEEQTLHPMFEALAG